MMPGLSGVDLLKAKASDEKIRNVPALIVTAIGMDDQIDEALNLGADRAITKPFSQGQLIEAIQGIIIS
jgi:CheY-like chemotaxis protein